MGKTHVMLLLLFATWFAGCGVIETVFKAGMWWGIILVVGVIALIFFVISKLFGRK